MENRNRFAILGVAASIVGVLAIASPGQAQNREARGTVTSVTDTSLSMNLLSFAQLSTALTLPATLYSLRCLVTIFRARIALI